MVKNELKKIFKLSSIFLRDSYQDINIINMKNNKLNKRSVFLWMVLILFVALFYVSENVVKFLVVRGQAEIFINIFFLILSILIMFQTILVCTNIFYFSKDLEFILPFPIKPVELLISKFITLMCKIYVLEIIFGIIPITIYGIYTNSSFLFYIYLIIVFLVFPIFLALVISIIMMFFMKLSKFIKNKDMFQVITTLLLIAILFMIEYKVMGNVLSQNKNIETINEDQLVERILEFGKKMEKSNKYFLVINPSIEAIDKCNLSSIIEILKIIVIDLLTFLIFIFIGHKTYLKDVLKNTIYLSNKKYKEIELYKKCRKKNKRAAYIHKEFKNLFRNPMFFMQCIYPVLISIVTIIIMSIIIVPRFQELFANEEFRRQIGDISFDITAIYISLGIMQFLFMMSTASLTGISREGKNAIFVKYIPISYYKQFIYKGVPQIFINMFSILAIVGIIYFSIPSVETYYLIYIFILGVLLNIINSYIMLTVDLLNPRLEWDTEYAVLKQNNNKIFQYVFTVLVIVFLIYFNNIFESINIDDAIFITGMIFLIIIIFINIFVKIKQKSLFEKIN